MSSRTYRSLSLANEVSRLENEWKSIKTNQVYSVSQFRTFRRMSEKVANGGWNNVYDSNGNLTSNKTPVFYLKSLSFRTLDNMPAWTTWQIVFYDSDGQTEIDPTAVGCACISRTNNYRSSVLSAGVILSDTSYDFYNSYNKTLYAQIIVVSTSEGLLDVGWESRNNV